jgi:hypothetical protein
MSWFGEAAPDVVSNPPVRAGTSPARPGGGGRGRRPRTLLGAGAVGVLVLLGLAGLVTLGADPVAEPRSRPPVAVVSAARDLLASLAPGYTVTGEAEWVQTTRRSYERAARYRSAEADEPLYVVQLRGRFTCAACTRPSGAPAQTGSAVGSAFPVDGRGGSSGSIGRPLDLSRLGTVHTFPVS